MSNNLEPEVLQNEEEDKEVKIIRVEIEREDGTVLNLTGEEAEKWQRATNSACSIAYIHGIEFPKLNWTFTKK